MFGLGKKNKSILYVWQLAEHKQAYRYCTKSADIGFIGPEILFSNDGKRGSSEPSMGRHIKAAEKIVNGPPKDRGEGDIYNMGRQLTMNELQKFVELNNVDVNKITSAEI